MESYWPHAKSWRKKNLTKFEKKKKKKFNKIKKKKFQQNFS